MWFTENAWQPMLLLGILATLLGLMYYRRLQTRYLIGAIALVLLAGATWVIEGAITTEREKVHDSVIEITRAFQQKDIDRTFSYVSEQARELRLLIAHAHNLVQVHDDMRVTDIQIEMANQQSRAVSLFRVNATLSAGPYSGREPTRWEARWQQEGGQWKMIDIRRLDPITGDVLTDFNEARQILSNRYGK